MQLTSAESVLRAAGLAEPQFRALLPNIDNYRALLLQPAGRIEASANGVRNQDRALALRQFEAFLSDAQGMNVDLAVTPEYSTPWETLSGALQTGTLPGPGQLWVIGCESIRYSELVALRSELAPHASVLFEDLEPAPGRFLDPLAYVFRTSNHDGSGTERVAVLVQFKTCPMGDDEHFEINGLQRGNRVYTFGGTDQSIRLVSLICSDVFDFRDPEANSVYDRALVIHIQLNPQPRQAQYSAYRQRLLSYGGDATEIICLNWARNVYVSFGGEETCWKNIAGSGWYLRPDKFDQEDATLTLNHKRGLYYTWCESLRSHVLFLNYDPGSYLFTATKVAHVGVAASLSRRRGPQLMEMRTWNGANTSWDSHATPDDGFGSVISESGGARDELGRLADRNPFEVERVLALGAGRVGLKDKWYTLRCLESCCLESSEIIRRITFCQDSHASAQEFRIGRLRRCSQLWDILADGTSLPPALADLRSGFQLGWERDFPHQNVVSANKNRATAIYMGEETSKEQAENVRRTTAELLHRATADRDKSDEACQRLAVWFRDDGKIELLYDRRYVKFDDPRSASEFDITRAT